MRDKHLTFDSKITQNRLSVRKILLVCSLVFAAAPLTLIMIQPAEAAGMGAVVAAIRAMKTLLSGDINGVLREVVNLNREMQRGFEGQTSILLQDAADRFYRDIVIRQQPTRYCEGDKEIPRFLVEEAERASYNHAVGWYNTTNSANNSLGINGPGDPAAHAAALNRKVRAAMQKGGTHCALIVPEAIGTKGTEGGCSAEEIEITNMLLVGSKPQPRLPPSAAHTAAGEIYERDLNSLNARLALANLSLNDTTSEERQQALKAFEKLLASPSIEELNTQSGLSGLERDKFVHDQIRAQLELESYKQLLEIRRLLAVQIAQQAENDMARLSTIRNAAAREAASQIR